MRSLLVLVIFVAVSSINGIVVRDEEQVDSELAGPFAGWKGEEDDSQRYNFHIAEHETHDAALWNAEELAKSKAMADHHAAFAAWQSNTAAEEHSRAQAFQAATQDKYAADQETAHALLIAKAATEEEIKALSIVREAEQTQKEVSAAALEAQNAAEELNKSFLAAQSKAEQLARTSAEISKIVEDAKQNAVLATRARTLASNAATLATQKLKSAEEALMKANQSAWSL